MKHFTKIIILAFALASTACLYRIDVQQGNEVTPKTLEQIQVGMTKRQVQRAIGLPLISDPFNKDRWDYFYSYKYGNEDKTITRNAALFFDGDTLVEIKANLGDLSDIPDSPTISNEELREEEETIKSSDVETQGAEERNEVIDEEEAPFWYFWRWW